MKQKIFFNSSLPRAGSTLLQNIIGQHPDFYVSPTSGLIDLMLGARIGYNDTREQGYNDSDLWQKGFLNYCKFGFDGFMKAVTDKPYYMDKSRMWGAYYDLVEMIMPKPKVIFMVRDLRSIYSSMEKKFRNNPDKEAYIMNNKEMQGITTPQRVEIYASSQPTGYSVIKLRELILQGIDKKILFLRYEDFCQYPNEHMKTIYEYLEVDYFEHNWNKIQQVTTENDDAHGIFGDHKIRNKLSRLEDDYQQILGDFVSNEIVERNMWFYKYFKYL
mgnify:CR=1 FL=1|tara:strand:- start:720 stop:1538 length:819 start_codon:yes stop_codon:yes gene_type:complete